MQRAQQLGRYHLLDRIAFGGMAEIYRAKTFDSDGHAHLVAVKRVLAHLVEDEDFIQMLVDEAKIASLLRHPNIARVYEFARATGEYFIAMEYIDGKDVRTILERCRAQGKPIPPQHAAWIASEAAAALHAAHVVCDAQGRSLNIVHRDVSPSNVICAYTGEVKLCDFGIAKATLSRVQTKTGVIKGKVKYMSPEQAMGRKLDHRSDIFSLGSVVYEMLTKQPPFTAVNEMDLLIKVRDAKYRPIRELEPDVPPALEAIVDRALARSRAARFQTADEMRMAMKAFLADYTPNYSRSYLGRYLRKMFETDIERELRQLEDYVLDEVDPANVGENLIADVLGPDAQYSKFTPIANTPAPNQTGVSQAIKATIETKPEPKLPPAPETLLPDTPTPPANPPYMTPQPQEARPRPRTREAAPQKRRESPAPPPAPAKAQAKPAPAPAHSGDIHHQQTMIIDRRTGKPVEGRQKKRWPGSPGGRDPRELDPAIHDAPTKIIRGK